MAELPVSQSTDAARATGQEEAVPADYGPVQVSVTWHTGLAEWQWDDAVAAGLIPEADVAGGRWSAAVADDVAARREEIVAVIGDDPPIGGHRAADRLAQRTGLDVQRPDVEALVDAGHLPIHDYYKEWPIYNCRDLDGVDPGVLAPIVAEREAWIAASVDRRTAIEQLGWRRDEFDQVVNDRGITPGPLARYAAADIDALRDDEDLAEQLRAERLIGPNQAAQHLEIRRTDFDYIVAAGWLAPHTYTTSDITRHITVDVPLFRVGDVEAVKEIPGIDWEALWSVKPGEPSPLREFARRPPDRATVLRRWLAEYFTGRGVEAWAWWHPGAGRWEIDWERGDGAPTVEQVTAALAEHPVLGEHRRDIKLSTVAGAAGRWARAMREPGAAVILDTETTDLAGYVVEVAVIDAATGDTLLDTLINPGTPITAGARWVHGITDDDVADAPTFAELLPDLLRATDGRTVLAYNAEFDADTIARHADRDGLDLAHLADDARWACLMGRRSNWELCRRWLPLGGGHRALGDCQTAYELLCGMTTPPQQPKAARR